jgi:hypothetical protein
MKYKVTTALVLLTLACPIISGYAADTPIPHSRVMPPAPLISSQVMAVSGDKDRGFLDLSQKKGVKEVSMKKAIILSLLFPGAGEYYADARFKGQVFMGVETAIWAGFLAYRVYGGWKADDYKQFAAAHAGVDNASKDKEFYDMIGFYDNREEYNQFGRLYYPDRPYYNDNSAYYWQWDSDASRLQFKNLKDASKTAFRNSTFLIGLAIANRVIAGIDTYRTVKTAQAKLRSLTQIGEYQFTVNPRPFGDNPRINISVSRKF